MKLIPQRTSEYHHRIWASDRWAGITPRPSDILIATGYRAGTTWMQRICSLLIFERVELPLPLHDLSPWIELETEPADQLWQRCAAQTHRRFLKTHTPLDGLPYWPEATYLFVGRDPRDVAISLWNQLNNSPPADRSGELPADFFSFLHRWLTVGTMPDESDGWPYWSYFRHAQSFWKFRHLPNIHWFHYDELLRDLPGQMRRVAALLEIPIAPETWQVLVEAASFEMMKSNAALLTPFADSWKDSGEFFKHGTSGQWREYFSARDLDHYHEVVAGKLSVDLAEWLHSG